MTAPESPTLPHRSLVRRVFEPRRIIHLVFWSWHAIWVLGVLFGIAPHVLPALVVDSIDGQVPWGITLSCIVLTLLPALTLLGGWRLRHDHWKLLRLFYGVGGVAFTLLFFRLFFIRQATAGVQLLLATLAFGALFYTAELFGGLPKVSRAAAVVRMVGYSALLIIGLYVGVTMGLYTIPATVASVTAFFQGFFDALSRGGFGYLLKAAPFVLLFLLFVLYSFTLLLGLPIAVAILYTRGWWRGLAAWSTERPRAQGLAITGGVIGLWIAAFIVLNQQPQHEAFERLRTPPRTLADQADHLEHTEQIRDGLLNAYLSPHRYWGATERNIQLARLYRTAFHTDEDVMGPQYLFNALAAPLLYDGRSMHADRAEAEIRYEQFFDRPLQQGEREAVMEAVSATYDRTQAEAGLLDVGQRKVLLTQQDIQVETHGDLARFTLHEVYLNQTPDEQEVFYYFNLPERAAITGLWLGDDENLARRFPYVVAPRGAAQQVYKEQRQRMVDPALLEQVGPRQYRLRAFPIPAPDRNHGGEPASLHLWMEWTVLGDGDGWPAPQLAEARNVFWEPDETERTIDGVTSDHEGWLPARFQGSSTPREHQIDMAGFRIRATPAKATTPRFAGRLAVVLETSRSMQAHAEEITETLDRIAAASPSADLYLAPSPYGAEQPRRVSISDAEPHYYGGHMLAGVLDQFESLRGDTEYDAVLVLSDEGSFAFLQDGQPAPFRLRGRFDDDVPNPRERYVHELAQVTERVSHMQPGAPVWLLHLGGLPHAYRDEVGDLLQRTRGGVATELDDVFARLGDGPVDGYEWSFQPIDHETPAADVRHDPFAPVAARALVGHLARRMDLETLEGLDWIHAVAVETSIVTPWSSMIVLVNDAQREALRRASEAEDRFEREAESGVESTTTPMGALELAATPEPEEWLLLIIGLLVVVIRLRSVQMPTPTAAA
ncbi:MAG: TIGR02921 family PEP-CTERM protein [Myxococcota bacterium]